MMGLVQVIEKFPYPDVVSGDVERICFQGFKLVFFQKTFQDAGLAVVLGQRPIDVLHEPRNLNFK